MWPEKNTAVLVIHGSGPHKLFEVCDKFARGFHKVLEEENDKEVHIRHGLRHRKEEGGWVQNYISLSLPDENRPTLDY